MKKIAMSIILAVTASACSSQSDEERYAEPATGPQDVVDANYCADLQQQMVGSKLPVVNEVHSDYKSFVKSKPSVEPLTSHQYVNYLPLMVKGQPQDFPAIISCKLKTEDVIKQTFGEDAAATEGSCQQFINRDLKRALSTISDREPVFAADAIVIEEDEVVRMGPKWLKPWPYPVAYLGEDGALHLRSKALLVPFSKLIPMPDRFKGTHYCHLPTAQYLEAVLLGDIKVAELVAE
ncbi:hypothetical protein [Oceanicoccus sp. KOV_DT_Chl]|uniref:hypothetical protein n=1 Tax=Oceanicoccus sp. KOV_DT_Chl TaxID=1904639 RepID=UPI000C7A2FB3|nr:hypothetical protein [Oceanicoccus sp. KOV_DT_Chl]